MLPFPCPTPSPLLPCPCPALPCRVMMDEPGGKGGGETGEGAADDVFLKKVETSMLSQVKLQGIEGIRKVGNWAGGRVGGWVGGGWGREKQGLPATDCATGAGCKHPLDAGLATAAKPRLLLPLAPLQVFLREAKRTRLDPNGGGFVTDNEWVLDTEGGCSVSGLFHTAGRSTDWAAARPEDSQVHCRVVPATINSPSLALPCFALPCPAGVNLLEVMCHPEVDYARTVSNDIIEMLQALGIEAARNALLKELRGAARGWGQGGAAAGALGLPGEGIWGRHSWIGCRGLELQVVRLLLAHLAPHTPPTPPHPGPHPPACVQV